MRLDNLPLTCIDHVFDFLELKELVRLSEVNKFFNYQCRNKRLDYFSKFLQFSDDSISIDMFPEAYLPNLTFNNFLVPSMAWKHVVFYMMLNNDNRFCRDTLKEFIPSNLMISIVGLSTLQLGNLSPSIKILDCPWRIINCPKEISHHLEYLNMSEHFYIPKHIDFSGRNLRVLHINMCRLDGLTFNFSRTLQVVSMFGCTGITHLKGFEYVEKLKMDYCDRIESLEPLKNIVELSMRHCSGIKDVSPIKNCEILDISHTNITDVSMLKNLKKITITGLEKLTFNVLRHDRLYLP